MDIKRDPANPRVLLYIYDENFGKINSLQIHDIIITEEDLPECCRKIRDAQIKKLNAKASISKKQCCHNDSYSYKSDLNKNSQSAQAVIIPVVKLSQFYAYNFTSLTFNKEDKNQFIEPPDPDVRLDFQSFNQVFII